MEIRIQILCALALAFSSLLAVAAELAKLEKSAASTWDATKTGFSNAYEDLQDSHEKAATARKTK